MSSSFVRHNPSGSYSLSNDAFKMVVGLTADQVPVMRSLSSARQQGQLGLDHTTPGAGTDHPGRQLQRGQWQRAL